MSKRTVYLDHAATTPLKPEVMQEMTPFFENEFGNPSSLHTAGRSARKAVEKARKRTAMALNAETEEIFFTCSGTEADNWAVKGAVKTFEEKGRHIITSAIEHPAVMNTCKYLQKAGCEVTYLPVSAEGIVSPDDVKRALRKDTVLITIMTANNEMGAIQPIKEIADIAQQTGVVFHTDSVQAPGSIDVDVKEMNIDMCSISAHKFYGPKGAGALYIRKDTPVHSFIHGGAQEKRKRAGTENVPGIVGLGKALYLACENLDKHIDKMTCLRDETIERIEDSIPHVRLNGHRTKRLPGNVNFSFKYLEGESLLLMLDLKGIYASTGSACSSGSLEASHVLTSMGLSHETAHGSLRFSFGENNTAEDIDYLMEVLEPVVKKLRKMSPLYNE